MKLRINKRIISLWLIMLLFQVITYCFNKFSGAWNFKASIYYNLFWSIHFCSLVAIFIVLFINKKTYRVIVPIILFIWFVIFYFQFNPIDTSTYPRDIKTLDSNGQLKQVLRKQQNMLTLEIKTDIVWVEDKFIFRRIIKKVNNSSL